MKKYLLSLCFLLISMLSIASQILIPMDNKQKNHLKAYGIAFWALEYQTEVQWLLNYRGGSFLLPNSSAIEDELLLRGVSYEIIADATATSILNDISSPSQNQDAIVMQKAPKIAVYSPSNKQPWDDAVTLVLSYAEIPYDIVYDRELLTGELANYDWLHLHHEDFTGQYGKFYKSYRHMPWYKKEVQTNEQLAHDMGFLKVSEMKTEVAKIIHRYVEAGGFLFAMCAATDTYDIALASENTDICAQMFDGDGADPRMNEHLNYNNTFAFNDFKVESDPYKYEFSDIDMTEKRNIKQSSDYFTLFEFSAKWDPVPTMLCQNHTRIVQGFMGQTTSYDKDLLKPEVVILGEYKAGNEARYIHGIKGKGFWTFYGGHDPEDYQHRVGDEKTDLNLHPNSPGYRLILNNILFPAAKKKKLKT